MRTVLPVGAPWRFFPAPLDALRRSSIEDIVGTRLPRDFFVRFGTGTGMGKDVTGRRRRREFAVAEEEAEEDRVVVTVLAPVVEEDPERPEMAEGEDDEYRFPCCSCGWWWYCPF
jgi:hypothetical protein